MLVLPAFRVVDPHVAHQHSWAVGIGHLNGERLQSVGSRYDSAVAVALFEVTLAEVNHAIIYKQMCKPLNITQIGQRKYRAATHLSACFVQGRGQARS